MSLLDFIWDAGAKTEDDTERDGFLSYSAEFHGAALGFYYGFVDLGDWDGLPENYADGRNIEDNWYPRGFYVIGAITRVIAYLIVGGYLAAPYLPPI